VRGGESPQPEQDEAVMEEEPWAQCEALLKRRREQQQQDAAAEQAAAAAAAVAAAAAPLPAVARRLFLAES
jgi:hypothetical protein